MRVAADELLAAVLGDRAEIARAALLEQQRQEVDLKEDVAELVEQLRVVAGVRRVGELVGLLDGVRDDRALVLLAVPRALAAQAARERVEARDRVADLSGRRADTGAKPSRRVGRVLCRVASGADQPLAGCWGVPGAAVFVLGSGAFLHCVMT